MVVVTTQTAWVDTELPMPHGDPEAIRRAAAALNRVSTRALATAGVRGDTGSELSLVWSGTVADRAAVELGVLSARSRAVLPQVGDAGTALLAYAEVLEATTARVRTLQVRAGVARQEHARLVAAARTASADPVATEAMIARADSRFTDEVREIKRLHGRALDELGLAASRCARVVAGLTDSTWVGSAGHGAQAGHGQAGLLGGLDLVGQQIRIASVPPDQPDQPDQPEQAATASWGDSALAALGGAAAWTYNHTAVPVVNAAADVAQAAVQHPGDVAEMAVGAAMIFFGGGGQVGGVALDATGVGAVVGVPLHLAAAGLVTAGASAVTHGARSLAEHASSNDNELLREVDGPYPDRGAPGDPLPDFLRPDGAGATWKGRVSDNGKGEVWQDPETYGNPANHTDARSMRYMDPTDRYPHGYVRYHGETGQTLDLQGKPGDRTTSHHPMTAEYSYDTPRGWKP